VPRPRSAQPGLFAGLMAGSDLLEGWHFVVPDHGVRNELIPAAGPVSVHNSAQLVRFQRFLEFGPDDFNECSPTDIFQAYGKAVPPARRNRARRRQHRLVTQTARTDSPNVYKAYLLNEIAVIGDQNTRGSGSIHRLVRLREGGSLPKAARARTPKLPLSPNHY
jgi:hypothetical protein